MLPFPEKLPTIDQAFLQVDGQYRLTAAALNVWGPLFAEAGIDIRQVRTPDDFQARARDTIRWRRAQHLGHLDREEHRLPIEDPRRKMTQALREGSAADFRAAAEAEDRRQAAHQRRSAFSVL
ncbi:hypothetical protein [Thiomonas sp.]